MNKKIIYPQVIFIIALAVLSGCTSYMKGTMDLERNNYEAAIESFQQELSPKLAAFSSQEVPTDL